MKILLIYKDQKDIFVQKKKKKDDWWWRLYERKNLILSKFKNKTIWHEIALSIWFYHINHDVLFSSSS